jgi:menaquinone-specific isochorismate synthase
MRVVTIEVSNPSRSLLDSLPGEPTTFIRHGDGLVGWGEAARLTATGARRFQQLATAWQDLIEKAEITDQVNLPGSGLVAFGSIAFADSSETESVLIIPKVTIGSRDGRYWMTRIDGAEIPGSAGNPFDAYEPAGAVVDQGVQLLTGTQTLAGFEQSVEDALKAIEAGTVEKVVLARDLEARIPDGFDLRGPLRKLAERYPSCWVYSVDGCFGASPELLVRVSHKQVSARVLAGTAGRGTDPAVDQAIGEALANSHKNLAEHTFAVDSMVRALEPFCDHVDADQTPFAMPLPNVWHLASDVHGVLKGNSSVLDLAAAIHPTAAVAGTPREASLELIEELEPFDRGRYAGPVGWIGADGDGEWAIALRGAQITGDVVRAFAGCGIVSESDPASEAAETELKFKPIVDALTKA